MGIIYRPIRGNIDDSMKECKYFNTFEDLQIYIANNYLRDLINLRPEEIVASHEPIYDERVGWLDSDYVCIDSYANIEDKEGYIRIFDKPYYHSVCIGIFATKWNRDQPNGILRQDVDLDV